MKLDHKTDAMSLEIVEGGRDPVVGTVLDVGNHAFRQEPTGDDVGGVSRLDAGCQAAQIGERRDVRRRAPIDRDSLVEFEIRLRKQRNGGAVRRNRRSRMTAS